PPAPTHISTLSLHDALPIYEAHSAGRPTSAHAATPEGMRRAILAGINTIEHGTGGTDEVFKLMREHDVAYLPTLAASAATSEYRSEEHTSELQSLRHLVCRL